jgi:hypothetical protein
LPQFLRHPSGEDAVSSLTATIASGAEVQPRWAATPRQEILWQGTRVELSLHVLRNYALKNNIRAAYSIINKFVGKTRYDGFAVTRLVVFAFCAIHSAFEFF